MLKKLRSTQGHALLLVVLTLAAWSGVPRGTFQYDDHASALWSAPNGEWRIRPLLALTYAADRALYGPNAAGFLAVNLVIHGLTVLVAYALARRVLSPTGAFLAGAAFALQPSHAEVVAYVSGRSTGLMTLLLLGGLWVWASAHDVESASSRRWRTGIALALFAAACLVKEVALIFPLLVLTWDVLAERRPGTARRLIPVAAVALGLALCLAAIPRYRALAGWSLAQGSPLDALIVNTTTLPFQLSLWVRPGMLSVEHQLNTSTLPFVIAFGLLAALVTGAVLLRRQEPRLLLAVVWAAVALAPTQSLLVKADVVTEKPLYLAWFGVALLVGGLLAGVMEQLQQRPRARLAACAALAALVLTTGLAVQRRVDVWRDPVSLWSDAAMKAPGSSRAWNNLGNALRVVNPDLAIAALRRSVALDPSNRYAQFNLASLEALCPVGCSAP